ncbi:MAG: hypothetical protein ACFFAS_18390 [Promethearchaeota archaeon]
MVDTNEKVKRTTVTLSTISMNLVDELVGVFGNTPATVISNIIDHFFYYSRFDDLLETLRAKKRELYPPDEKEIEKRITRILKGADQIPFDEFINDIGLDRKFVVNNFHIWSEKFNIKRYKNLIIKN